MGLHKQFKTGAVVGSYPKPMLVLMLDEGGLDVVPPRSATIPPDLIKMDCVEEDITWIKPEETLSYANKKPEELSKVTAIDFYETSQRFMSCDLREAGTTAPFSKLMDVMNALSTVNSKCDSLVWKTILFDNLTAFGDYGVLMVRALNPDSEKDMRAFAPFVGGKVEQLVRLLTSLKAHVVVLVHTTMDKDEKVGVITENPMIMSKYRNKVGKDFSSVFYATKENGKPVLWTTDQMFVRGIGGRWPVGLPPKVAPDFKSIYGKELQ